MSQVRKHTAEQLYLTLLEEEAEEHQTAADLLLEAAWDDNLRDLEPVHLQLKDMLKVA